MLKGQFMYVKGSAHVFKFKGTVHVGLCMFKEQFMYSKLKEQFMY